MKKLWILGVVALLPIAAHADRYQERVAKQVENRMESAPGLRGYNFTVQTVGRYLQLRGTVRTSYERRQAERIARRHSGGFPVRDLIVINPMSHR